MPLITETYYLSLTQDNRGILRLRCSQNDTLRTANLKLYNNGSTFTIPSGISAYVSGVKQNGAVFSKSCTISQDRKSVVLQLSSDITNVDGIIVAEIVLNDGNGDRLGTSNFIIQVEKNPIRVGVIQDTETPIEYINDFITQIQALTARVNNLITPNGDPSLAEVVDARISSLDSNTYQNLKARIDADIATLNTRKANKSEVYTKSQVDNLLENVEIDVDDALSDESENPVQNKVINRTISEIKADLIQAQRQVLFTINCAKTNQDNMATVQTGLLLPGHTYRIYPYTKTWEIPDGTSGTTSIFWIQSGSVTPDGFVWFTPVLYIMRYPTVNLPDYIDITIPKDSNLVQIALRAKKTAGELSFRYKDIGVYGFSKYFGKISIIGDSIETFNKDGYKIDGYAMHYPAYDVVNVSQTWWHKLITVSDATLEVNASDAGSRVTNTHPNTSHPDFYDRVSLVGNPNVVFVTLGTNDSNANVSLGEYDFTTAYTDLSESTFRTAYIKGIKALQTTYPNVKIVCVAEKMQDAYFESIKTIADTLGCSFVDCRDYDTSLDSSGIHPSLYGMNQILSNILYQEDYYYEKVNNEISALREDVESIEPGLSDDAKTALLACFEHLFWEGGSGRNYINALRIALGASNRRPELPSAYEQVEYIYGNGQQWFTFDFLSQSPFSVEAKVLYTSNDANILFANTDPSTYPDRRFYLLGYNNFGSGTNTDIGIRIGNNPWFYSHGHDLNTIYKIQMGVYQTGSSYKAYIQIDDNERVETTLNNTPTLGNPMCLHKRDTDSWVGRGTYFYSLVCYAGGNQKIFDGIPCYRRSDNVSGFYDAVTNTFYSSEGSSDFLVGPIVE